MFKIQARKNVQATLDYFLHEPELATEEKVGRWLGRGALSLGLIETGDGRLKSEEQPPIGKIVLENDLRSVLEGYTPGPGVERRPLNGRYRSDGIRRCAWDCVLSPHKSISVAALVLPGDHEAQAQAVRLAFDRARNDAFELMESLARRQAGAMQDVETGSLLAAAFTHFTSRRNDPQLHTHLLVMNATRDTGVYARREWYALEPLQFYRQARAIDAVFQRELVRHLRGEGLDARLQHVDNIPVAVLPAVSAEICERNSRAHQAIIALVEDRWERTQRTSAQRRQENLLNDRYRPSKSGQLAERPHVFERALTKEEAAEIVGKMTIAVAPPPKADSQHQAVRKKPCKTVKERIREAFERMGSVIATPKRITLAAVWAAREMPDRPFKPYLDAARYWANRLFVPPSEGLVADWMAQTEKRAHAEFEEYQDENAIRIRRQSASVPMVDHPKAEDRLRETLQVRTIPRQALEPRDDQPGNLPPHSGEEVRPSRLWSSERPEAQRPVLASNTDPQSEAAQTDRENRSANQSEPQPHPLPAYLLPEEAENEQTPEQNHHLRP